MKIGIIGWYGHHNAGDERILYCLKRFFSGHNFFIATSFNDAVNNIENLNSCDLVLLGGGGLILRNFGKFADLINRIKPRFICVGISAEAKNYDNIALYSALIDKSECIYVRDEKSAKLFDNNPKVLVGPDLTYLYPYTPVPEVNKDVCGINLRDWHYANVEYGGILYKKIAKLTKRMPVFRDIYPFPKWEPEKFMKIVSMNFTELIPLPLYTEEKTQNDIAVLSKFFKNISTPIDSAEYFQCRYLIGMRLHSLIFASQFGIPFISMSYQPKNIEFCKSVDPSYSQNIFDLTTLIDRIQTLKENYHLTREKLLEFSASQQNKVSKVMNSIFF